MTLNCYRCGTPADIAPNGVARNGVFRTQFQTEETPVYTHGFLCRPCYHRVKEEEQEEHH